MSSSRGVTSSSVWSLKTLYFVPYNSLLAVRWAYVLAETIRVALTKGHAAVYAEVEFPLQLAQTAAVLEIINSLLGLVRSPISATLPQISSRLYLVWGILFAFPEVRSSPLVVSLLVSWGITEVIRYSFFALKESTGEPPKFLLWLRYSSFFVLYPTGIASEMGLIWLALPYIKNSNAYNINLPNKFNFAFDYYIISIIALLAYLPGGPFMYTYMIAQRKKVLGRKEKTQ